MNESFEIKKEDNYHKEIVGENAINEYYKHYKKLDKIRDQNKYFQVPGIFYYGL